MLKHDYQIYPGGAVINQLTNPLYSSEFKSIVSGDLSWSLHNWSSTVFWHRYGPSPNYTAMVNGPGYPGAAQVSPWITWNWSVTYSPTKDVDVSLLTNNITNKMPPKDGSFSTTFPYFNTQNYNVYGRQVMLQLNWRFGGRTN
jgi:outer membrane receptor for ferrienterochelin and colicin